MEYKMSVQRTKLVSEFVMLMDDCFQDHVFDLKRIFFKQLAATKTERGDKIKEISNRRKMRNLKLVPFLVCSCQKHIVKRKVALLKEGFNAIFMSSIQPKSIPQTSYQIKERSSGHQLSGMRDVSKNLKPKFDTIQNDSSFLKSKTKVENPRENSTRPKSSKCNTRKPLRNISPIPDRSIRENLFPQVLEIECAPKSVKVKSVSPKPNIKKLEILVAEKREQVSRLKAEIKPKARNNQTLHTSRSSIRFEEPSKDQSTMLSILGNCTMMSTHCDSTYIDPLKQNSVLSRASGHKGTDKNIIKGLKTLSLLMNIRIKSYRKRLMEQVRKLNTEKIRKVISVYKRRNFMAAEKTLTTIRSHLFRHAFGLVKAKKRVVVPRDIQNLRLILMAETVARLAIQHTQRRILNSLRVTFNRGHESEAKSLTGSELVFKSIAVNYREPQSFKTRLNACLVQTYDHIKGHKRAKKHFAISLALHFLHASKCGDNRALGFGALKSNNKLLGECKAGFQKLRVLFEAANIRDSCFALQKIQVRAQRQKDKNLGQMIDILSHLFKQKSVQPAFYFWKFDYNRILKNNNKVYSQFLVKVEKTMASRTIQYKMQFWDNVKLFVGSQRSKSITRVTELQSAKTREVSGGRKGRGVSPKSENQISYNTTSLKKDKILIEKIAQKVSTKPKTEKENLDISAQDKSNQEIVKEVPGVINKHKRAASGQNQIIPYEKDVNRVNRLLNAITQENKSGIRTGAKEITKKNCKKNESVTSKTCGKTTKTPGNATSKPIDTRDIQVKKMIPQGTKIQSTKTTDNLKSSRRETYTQGHQREVLGDADGHWLESDEKPERPTVTAELLSNIFDHEEDETEQFLDIERQEFELRKMESGNIGQLTVHDLKSVIFDKVSSHEQSALYSFQFNSKYNSRNNESLVGNPCVSDYFSFQKSIKEEVVTKDHDSRLRETRFDSFKPAHQNTFGQNPFQMFVKGKENIPVLTNVDNLSKLDGHFVGMRDGGLKNQDLTDRCMKPSTDLLRPNALTEKSLNYSALDQNRSYTRYHNYGTSSEEKDEEESEDLNDLIIVKNSESKLNI